MTTATPAVYVGTYHKYNSGSLYGKWLRLDEFSDADEFYLACTATHWDEEDPELMFQDWEGIPEHFICESGLQPEYWDYLEAIEQSYLDAEVFEAAAKLDLPFDMVDELYQGQHHSDEDFAYQLADEIGMMPEGNNWPSSYID